MSATLFRKFKKEINYVTRKDWNFEDVGKFWNTVKDYDEIDDETYAYKRRFYDSMRMFDSIRMSNLPKKGRCLDIDCRTGNGTVFYSKNKKINKAVCITPSSDFLNVCKKRLKKYNIKAKVMLLRELPLKLKSNYFDLILCLETIEHISPKRRLDFLKELNRLIKDRGKMVLSMPNILWEPVHWGVAIFGIHHSEGPHKFLSRREIKRLFEQSNFKIIKQETTVLIPVGSKWLTSFGEILEKSFKNTLMPLIGLRRIYICEKIK